MTINRKPKLRIKKKNYSSTDEIQKLPKAIIETITIGNSIIKRITHNPGWKWSQDVKPLVGMDSCPNHHLFYVLSGRLAIVMTDNKKDELIPGDIVDIP